MCGSCLWNAASGWWFLVSRETDPFILGKALLGQDTRKTAEEGGMAYMWSACAAATDPLLHRKKCAGRNCLATSVPGLVAESGWMAYNCNHLESTYFGWPLPRRAACQRKWWRGSGCLYQVLAPCSKGAQSSKPCKKTNLTSDALMSTVGFQLQQQVQPYQFFFFFWILYLLLSNLCERSLEISAGASSISLSGYRKSGSPIGPCSSPSPSPASLAQQMEVQESHIFSSLPLANLQLFTPDTAPKRDPASTWRKRKCLALGWDSNTSFNSGRGMGRGRVSIWVFWNTTKIWMG